LKRDLAKVRGVAGVEKVQHFIDKSKNNHSMTSALNCALSYTLNSFCQGQKIHLKIIDRTCKYAIAQNKIQKPEIVRPAYSGILKQKEPQKSWVRP
jgi:hypothetical protein